jgi:hypothetical protein
MDDDDYRPNDAELEAVDLDLMRSVLADIESSVDGMHNTLDAIETELSKRKAKAGMKASA